MKALLLAAGFGKRLLPLTSTTPKCLVPIGGKPLLQHWLESLAASRQFEKVIINTHYLAEKVGQFFSSYIPPIDVDLSYESKLLGPGGTLLRHREQLASGEFLVAHADNFSLINWPEFLGAFNSRPKHCLGLMMTFESDDPSSCGIVQTDAQGVVTVMHEKVQNPPGRLANAATFLFSPRVFEIIGKLEPRSVFDISEDIIPSLHGRIATYKNTKYHRDIGTLAALAQAREDHDRMSRVWVSDET